MEWDGKVGVATLQCSVTARPLVPGEVFYSALLARDDGFVRQDFADQAWAGIDRQPFLSWWRHTVPVAERKAQSLKLDAVVLGQLFDDLKGSTVRASQCFCYVVALCLVRLRKLRLRDVERRDEHSFLLLEQRPEGILHRLRDPRMSPAEEEAVRRNLMQVINLEPSIGVKGLPADAGG